MRLIHRSTPLAALLAGACPALAQIAPEDVWAEMREGIERTPQAQVVSVEETREGEALTLRDLTIRVEDQVSTTTVVLPEIVLRQADDGVALELPERAEVEVTVEDEWSDRPGGAVLAMTHSGLTATITGESVEDYDYSYAADRIGFEVVSAVDPYGEEFPGTLTMAMSGLEGSYEKTADGEGLERIVQNGVIARTEAAMDVEEEGFRASFTMDLADLRIEADTTVAADLEPADFIAALDAGFAGTGIATIGATTYAMDVVEPSFQDGGPATEASFQGGATSGRASFAMSNEGIEYEVETNGPEGTFQSTDLPIGPSTARVDRLALNLSLPVREDAEPQDFAYGIALEGLTVSDNLWDMLPMMTGTQIDLPRDPMTLRIALSGQATLPFELLDPGTFAGAAPPPPPVLSTLNLDDLLLTGAGIELTGSGAIAFDADDMETWGGVPAPSGTIDLALSGLQGLIQTLVQAGIVPADQALFAQGMIGAVARPVGEDAYESEIVFGPGAQITANGFPIPIPQ
ncbi:MAG: DUF2125 domain-containing protein [Hasllibacter sp.]